MGGHNAARKTRQAVQLSARRFHEKKAENTIQLGGRNVPTDKTDESFGNRFHLIKDGAAFHDAITTAKLDGLQEDKANGTYGTKASDWYGAYVHAYSPEEYNEMATLLALDNGAGGLAVKKSGDIVSVFRNPTQKARGVVDTLMPEAIAAGGNHLDCFNGFLPETYAKYGFFPVARVKFSPKDAPEHWNSERDGEPDVIYMVHDGRSVERIKKDISTYYNAMSPEQRAAYNAQIKKKVQKMIAALPYSEYNDAPDPQVGVLKHSPEAGILFASPNRREDLQIPSAQEELVTPRQQRFRDIGKDIDEVIGTEGKTTNAVGAWVDGAENSTAVHFDEANEEQLKVVAAMRGFLGDQKSVLWFKPNKAGSKRLHEFSISGDMEEIHQKLIEAKIKNHTIIPLGENRYRVFVYEDPAFGPPTPNPGDAAANVSENMVGIAQMVKTDPAYADWVEDQPDEELIDPYKAWQKFNTFRARLVTLAKTLGGTIPVTTLGEGDFIGDWDSRKAGQEAYMKIIQAWLDTQPEAIRRKWSGVAQHWLSNMEENN